jgi:hypothetical protein
VEDPFLQRGGFVENVLNTLRGGETGVKRISLTCSSLLGGVAGSLVARENRG